MKSLYEISTEALEIASLLEQGELTEELENLLLISQSELQNKSVNYAYVCKSFENDVSSIDQEIKRLGSLKKSKINAVDRLKETMKTAMNIYGIEEIKTPTIKINFRKSESVEIINESSIDAIFKSSKVVESIDKIAIKKAIKEGNNIEGAILNINQNIQIK